MVLACTIAPLMMPAVLADLAGIVLVVHGRIARSACAGTRVIVEARRQPLRTPFLDPLPPLADLLSLVTDVGLRRPWVQQRPNQNRSPSYTDQRRASSLRSLPRPALQDLLPMDHD